MKISLQKILQRKKLLCRERIGSKLQDAQRMSQKYLPNGNSAIQSEPQQNINILNKLSSKLANDLVKKSRTTLS